MELPKGVVANWHFAAKYWQEWKLCQDRQVHARQPFKRDFVKVSQLFGDVTMVPRHAANDPRDRAEGLRARLGRGAARSRGH